MRGSSSAWRWALLAIALAAPVPAAAHADDEVYGWDAGAEARAVGQASQGFLDAFRKADERAMDAVASARVPDAVLVLAGLLSSHMRASLETPPNPADYLPAARAFVARGKENPAARGATELLATWERFRRDDLERELRLKDASRGLERKDDPASCERDLAKIAALEADMTAARGSFSASMLGIERGRCLRVLRRDASVAAARAARAIAESVPWPLGAARAARLQAIECIRLGDMDGAVEATRVISRVHRDLGDLPMGSKAENRLSRLLRVSARYDEALVASRQAAEDARAAGRDDLVAHAWIGEASLHAQLGRGPEVVRLATDAAALFLKVGDPLGEASAWTTLATDHVLHDRFAEALLACDRAKEALGRTSGAVVATFTWTNLGIVHRRLGRLDLALEDQRSALAEAEKTGEPGLIGLARGNLGLVEIDLNAPTAPATLEQALREKRKARDGEGAWDTELALATYLERRTDTASEGKQRLENLVAEARRLGDPFRQAVALDALATAAARGPGKAAALPFALEAAAIYASLGERSMRAARVHELLARLYLAEGKPAQSLEASLQAVAFRRSGLAGLGEEDAALQGEVVRRASDVGLEAALAWSPSEPDRAAAGAFELLEGARAALLTAGIVNAEAFLAAEVPEAARAAEAASRARVEASRARLVELYRAPRPPTATATAAARADLDQAWAAHEQAVARIRREETRAAGVAFPRPVGLAEFRATLAADVAYVAFQVTPQRVVALVVTRERATLRDLGPSEGLAARVEGWLRLAGTPGTDDTRAAAALYDALLRPLEEDVKGRAALVVSPDGPLSFAPLEALVRSGEGGATRALERWTVSYVPSASVLTALRAESAKLPAAAGFVGLGDPDHTPRPGAPSAVPPDLPPLPASAAEVREVAAVYPAATRTILLGAKASRADLLAALASRGQRVRALHLATHAFLDPERPRRSCLVLAGGDVLDVDAIHRLRVPADLAVLSACGTGRGALVAGEGVSGLARGFFIAGVLRVVVSAWVVSDASTAPVLVAFHRGVEAEKKTYAASLRAAKLAALARGGAAAHPSTWAAFTLWGLPE